jgi:hypothetical protein
MRHCGRGLFPVVSTGGRRVVLEAVGTTVVIREVQRWSTSGRTLGTTLRPFARFGTGKARIVGLTSCGCDSMTGRWVDVVTRLSNTGLGPGLRCSVQPPGSCHPCAAS